MKGLEISFNPNEIKWDYFVENHPNGNVFQTSLFRKIYTASAGYKPLVIALVNENEYVGILVAYIKKDFNGILGELTSRSIIIGGPIVKDNNPELLSVLLDSYNSLIKGKVIFTQIRNFWVRKRDERIFMNNRFDFEDHLNIIVNLDKSVDELWSSLDSKARNKIRKSEKLNLEFRILSKDEMDVNAIYDILKETYERAKTPLSKIDFFENALSILGDMNKIKVFGAYKDGNLIAIRIGLLYSDTIYDWYAGSLSDFHFCNPNDFLPFKIMEYGINNSFKVFDFGGAGKPNIPYGVRDHKLKFGGDLVEFGRFQNIHNSLLMSIGKLGLKLYKKFKS